MSALEIPGSKNRRTWQEGVKLMNSRSEPSLEVS